MTINILEHFVYKYTKHLVIIMLLGMFALGLSSAWKDSTTMDELAHISAGYSYLKYGEMRLNPEHPPVVKDLAAIPLLFIQPKFPERAAAWAIDPNGQWEVGRQFLYKIGNNANQILLWARIPGIIFMCLGGFIVYKIANEIGQRKNKFVARLVGLLAVFLYAFGPTMLTNGRLVTTDAAVSVTILAALYCFIRYFKNSTIYNLILAIGSLALTLLTKFSSFFLLLVFFILLTCLAISRYYNQEKRGKKVRRKYIKLWLKYLIFLGIISICTFAIIYIVYWPHVRNMEVTKIHELVDYSIYPGEAAPVRDFINWTADLPGGKPIALYLTGFSMVFGRVYGGNNTFLFGEYSTTGWWYYFPVLFLVKTPIAFLSMMFTSFVLLFKSTAQRFQTNTKNRFKTLGKSIVQFPAKRFLEFGLLTFIVLYWLIAISGELNIGIRHILPTIPMMQILVSNVIINYMYSKSRSNSEAESLENKKEETKKLKWNIRWKAAGAGFFILCLFWYLGANLYVHPSYMSYFNEFVGGSSNGYKYAIDSNCDWGQDLRRLTEWADKHKIDHIKLDYFGGADGSEDYYLSDKYERWSVDRTTNEGEPKGWFAVSVTFYQWSKRVAEQEGKVSYEFLDDHKPVTFIGNSILVYYLD